MVGNAYFALRWRRQSAARTAKATRAIHGMPVTAAHFGPPGLVFVPRQAVCRVPRRKGSANANATLMRIMKTYRHFKGALYRVLLEDVHDVNNGARFDRLSVIYQNAEGGPLCSRFADEFHQTVEHQGQTVPRFTLIQ